MTENADSHNGAEGLRRQPEEALRRVEEKYRSLVETAGAGIAIIDLKEKLTFVNDRLCLLSGYPRAELIGQPFAGFICEDDLPLLKQAFIDAVGGVKRSGMLEFRLVRRDGQIIWVHGNPEPEVTGAQISGFNAIIYDITDRKRLEEELREREAQFSATLENAPDGVYINDLEGNFLYGNRRCEEIIGYKREELIGKNFLELNILPDSSLARAAQILQDNIDGKSTGPDELELISRDGRRVPVEINTSVMQQGGKKVVLAFVRDITERKKTDEKLRETDAQYRLLSEHMQDTVWLMDMNRKITYQSPSVQRRRGFTPREAMELPLEKQVTPESFKLANEVLLEELLKMETEPGYNTVRKLELEYYRKDGTTLWSENTFSILRDDNGKPVSILGEGRDITERKMTEEALRESEERYRSILEQMQDAYYEVDLAGNFTFVNASAAGSFGYSREEMLGQNYRLTVPKEDIKSIFAAYNEVYRTAKPNRGFPHRVLHKDGRIAFSEMSIALKRNNQGETIGFKSVSRDITERKRLEDELQKLASVVRNSSELINLSMPDGKMIFLNEAGAKILGIDQQDIERFNIMQAIPGHLKDKVQAELLPALLKGGTWEGDLQYLNLKTGSLTDVHATTFAIKDPSTGAPLYFANVSLDITGRKQAEDAVRRSSMQFQSIIEHVSDIFYMQNRDRELIYISPQAEQVLGYTLAEMQNGWQYYLTDDPMNLAGPEKSQLALTTGEKQGPYMLEFMGRDGKKQLVEINESPIKDDSGEVIGMVGAARDVTERKRIESALIESEEKYRMVVENSLESIYIAVDGILQFGNRRAAELSGYSQEELVSRPFIEFIHPDDRQMVVDRYLQRLKGIDVPGVYSFRIIDKSGNTRWVELSAVLITWEGRPATLNFLTDVTDRRRLEEERQRVEKLESVGLLAAGIAHDFNNILTAILGNISLAGTEAVPGSELQNSLKQAEKASQRARELTQQLLTFSKGGTPVTKLASLTDLLKDTVSFALRGSNVKCHFSLPTDLWHAEIDTGQVSQIIHNLVINAQQAMPAGGSIEVLAENMSISKKQSLGKGLPLNEGNYVRVTVADHGSGISSEHLEKIFDPFFTTKRVGSGLGLATSFSIARNHGGHLSVESEPGSGSTFYLYLPASTQTETPGLEKKDIIKPVGESRVLVMDDEQGVRDIAGRMLKHLGYADIQFAADGAAAIKLFKEAIKSGKPFTVALLDLTIAGGMGGVETIKKLLKIDPGVRAIVSSGYADDPVIARYGDYGFSGMVAKPYNLTELGKAMHDVIG